MRPIDASAGRLSLPTNEEGFITANGRIRTPDGSLIEFRITEGVLEVQDLSAAWNLASYDEGTEIFYEISRRLQAGFEQLVWQEGRLKLIYLEEDIDDAADTDPDEDPTPAPVARVRRSLRERIFGKPYTVDPESYVPGEGFVNESVLLARGHTGPTLDPKVARSTLNAVRKAAEAESTVRRFGAIWEDLTVRIPFTEQRIPLPALDPLLSVIPIVGEVVDGVIPMGVFWYNGLKAGLGVGPLAKGTTLQMGNLALHVLKYGGPTAVIKFVIDWYFNSITATTHDFMARRQQAIEVARGFGITDEDIDKVSKEAIERSTVTERKTQNSRKFKRTTIKMALALLAGKLGVSEKDFEHAHPYAEKFLDFFYPLEEDRDREEGEFTRLARKLAHAYGAHKDAHGHGGDSHGHADSHGHGTDHGHADSHAHEDTHGHESKHGHAESHGHEDHGHASHGHDHAHAESVKSH